MEEMMVISSDCSSSNSNPILQGSQQCKSRNISKKFRSQNMSDEEVHSFLGLIRANRKFLVKDKYVSGMKLKEMRREWCQMADQLASEGFPQRTGKQLMKKWSCLKSETNVLYERKFGRLKGEVTRFVGRWKPVHNVIMELSGRMICDDAIAAANVVDSGSPEENLSVSAVAGAGELSPGNTSQSTTSQSLTVTNDFPTEIKKEFSTEDSTVCNTNTIIVDQIADPDFNYLKSLTGTRRESLLSEEDDHPDHQVLPTNSIDRDPVNRSCDQDREIRPKNSSSASPTAAVWDYPPSVRARQTWMTGSGSACRSKLFGSPWSLKQNDAIDKRTIYYQHQFRAKRPISKSDYDNLKQSQSVKRNFLQKPHSYSFNRNVSSEGRMAAGSRNSTTLANSNSSGNGVIHFPESPISSQGFCTRSELTEKQHEELHSIKMESERVKLQYRRLKLMFWERKLQSL